MHDDKWDENIKHLLNDMEEDYDPASWQKLSDRMESMDLEEADRLFDQTVKEKLEPYQTVSGPDQWEVLEQKLNTTERRRRNIVTTKSLEGIILILTFFTLWNFRVHTIPEIEVDETYVNNILNQNELPALISATLDHTYALEEGIFQKQILISIEEQRAEDLKLNISSTINSDQRLIKNNYLNPFLAIGKMDVIPVVKIELSFVPKLKIEPFEIPIIAIANIPFILANVETDETPFDGWNIGMSQSFDVNFVNSDITLGYLGDQIRSGLTGHSITITTSYRKKFVEIGTGIGYSAKSFAPGLHTHYQKASANSSAFLQSQLDEVTFKQIFVPLTVKVFVAPMHKTSFYVTVGVVANALLETDYTIQRSIQANVRPASDPRVNIIDLNRPPEGLAHGGTLKDNFFATGLIGFGVQSYLNNGVSWFVQPQYQHTLTKDINEIANEINTLSISAGLQFRL